MLLQTAYCWLQAIEMLDHRQGLPRSHLWPPESRQMPEDDQEAAEDIPKTAAEADQQAWEELPVQARLAEALDYLRQRYHYCLFCGCQVCVLPHFAVATSTVSSKTFAGILLICSMRTRQIWARTAQVSKQRIIDAGPGSHSGVHMQIKIPFLSTLSFLLHRSLASRGPRAMRTSAALRLSAHRSQIIAC